MFSDAVDSFYEWVKARIENYVTNVQSPSYTRTIKGIFNAQDWPAKRLVPDAFYLLVLGEEPVGKQGWSPATPIVFHQVQWVWVNKGTDLAQANVQQANRGDRYRTAQLMKQELLYGMNPGYSPKLSYAMNGASFVGMPKVPAEAITWTPISGFHEKLDKQSGLLYVAAATRIQDMTDTITS